MARMKGHPGFKAVQEDIARREGVSEDRAGAMLAASTRRASPAAKQRNPRLNRVKGKSKSKGRKKGGTTTVFQGNNSFRSY